MTDEDVGDYDLLKNSLLKRFRLTEGGYRKRFKSVRIEVGETAEQFVDRLKKYLTKWREMAGFDATYEGLQNMILREQFFITCDKALQILFKEKGKLNLKEITQAVDQYVEAHGHEINRSESKQNKWNTVPFGRCTHRTSKIGDIGACWYIGVGKSLMSLL